MEKMGIPKLEAYSMARRIIMEEGIAAHKEANKKGCLVALLIIIAPTILLYLTVN